MAEGADLPDLLDFAKLPMYGGPVKNRYSELYGQPEPASQYANITSSNNDLQSRDFQTIQYTKSILNEGDTLVFIKFPNDEPVYHSAGFQLRTEHVVHYAKLVATGSQKFINVLDSREQQLRLQRRFGLVGRLPEGIKYLLDLTPPGEGDEAVAVTVLLSCPIGVRKWHTSEQRCGVAANLVGGRDELTHQDLMRQSIKNAKAASSEDDPEEYCKIRHRTGIERLLQIIEGKDPRLDSAPKVWTLVMLAHYFGCVKQVEDHILSWLLAEPNNRFIEILPEATLKIGTMLENEHVTRFAFSVLVSEKALALGCDNICRKYEPEGYALIVTKSKTATRFGRHMEDVDEDWTNMIQYAAQAFAGRIHQQVRDLLSTDFAWIRSLPEYQKILDFEKFLNDGSEIINRNTRIKYLKNIEYLNESIRDFIRGRLFRCMLSPLTTDVGDRLNAHRLSENYLTYPEVNFHFKEIYNSLNDQEKVLTRPFWQSVQQLDWSTIRTDNEIFDTHLSDLQQQYYNERIGENYKVRFVKPEQIVGVANTANLAIYHGTKEMGYNGGVLPLEAYGNYSSGLHGFFYPLEMFGENYAPTAGIEVNETSPAGPWTAFESDSVPTNGMRNLSIFNGSQQTQPPPISNSYRYTPTSPIAPSNIFTELDEIMSVDEEALSSFTSNVANDDLFKHGLFPRDETISPASTFLSLTRLLNQVSAHFTAICFENLSKGGCETSTLCDTLLSLSDKEFAFLPLWAGGMNDGSGGVFATEIPLAERGAPNQPGPAYHTGSTLNSAAGSEMDFDGQSFSFVGGSGISEGGDTSLGVENGEDDHLNRRAVVSESDFPTHERDSDAGGFGSQDIAFSAYAESEAPMPVASRAPVVPSYIEDANFFNTPDEVDASVEDEEEDWDILDDDDDDDGEETETED